MLFIVWIGVCEYIVSAEVVDDALDKAQGRYESCMGAITENTNVDAADATLEEIENCLAGGNGEFIR